MPLTLTARRTEAARQIKLALAHAETELAEATDDDQRASLEGLINALRERLQNRRSVVLAARQVSLHRGMLKRRYRQRQPVVWGFPAGFNPNTNPLDPIRCEICRRVDAWVGRALPGQSTWAWTCSGCPELPAGIPE